MCDRIRYTIRKVKLSHYLDRTWEGFLFKLHGPSALTISLRIVLKKIEYNLERNALLCYIWMLLFLYLYYPYNKQFQWKVSSCFLLTNVNNLTEITVFFVQILDYLFLITTNRNILWLIVWCRVHHKPKS